MKKSPILAVLILVLAFVVKSVPAYADSILYTNITPASYVTGNWEISGPYNVIDSFTLTQSATVTEIEFGEDTSEDLGQSPEGVSWSISAGPSPSPVYPSAATIAYTSSSEISSSTPPGFTYNGGSPDPGNTEVWLESFSVPDLSLSAGTYWLQLQNADIAGGTAGWDMSSGPSQAELFLGIDPEFSIPSETFEILGTSNAATPEPSSFLLLASGLAGLAGLIGRKAMT